jgi:putative thiamine transport system permease protein
MQLKRHWIGAAPFALLFLVPLCLSLALLLPSLLNAEAMQAFLQHPQFAGAFRLTLLTGCVSTIIAITLAIVTVAQTRRFILQQASVFLSLPHLALAMGFGFMIAPTGVLARLIATLITGWTAPPLWQTTQDPHGFALIAALVLKETPFLVWAMSNILQQEELQLRFAREAAIAQSLGHGARSIFLRLVLPQILPRVMWPIIAVFTYGMTVVDMALVIGPTQPPTLAQLLWTDLNDGEVLTNQQGASGTLLLSAMVAALLGIFFAARRSITPLVRRWMTCSPKPENSSPIGFGFLWPSFGVIYTVVVMALLLQSVSALWPFPKLLAQVFTATAWLQLFQDFSPVATSLTMALISVGLASVVVVVWLETQAAKWDRIALIGATLMLCLPAVLVALGQYRLLLWVGATGTLAGLIFAHVLPVTAYIFVMLHGPYRAFDPRWQAAGQGLGAAPLKFLLTVKWPMLKAPLLSALAIGFAVSIQQFVSAQLASAGRFSTLPMEAVTLSSGGNRALIAAYALMLMALPLLAFLLASWAARPRWSSR